MSATATPAPVFETDVAQKTGTEAMGAASSQPSATREEIAQLAYTLWQARGCPEGSSEQDWLEAEQQLLHISRNE